MNQPRKLSKKIRLGEKTTVLYFQTTPLRGKDAPKMYRIVIRLRTCLFDSHMCFTLNE